MIGFGRKTYLQESGVCIGSRVAPALSAIFLGSGDKELVRDIKDFLIKVSRYADDYWVLTTGPNLTMVKEKVLDTFRTRGKGLKFTCKAPS